jgi:hypothetical protein
MAYCYITFKSAASFK